MNQEQQKNLSSINQSDILNSTHPKLTQMESVDRLSSRQSTVIHSEVIFQPAVIQSSVNFKPWIVLNPLSATYNLQQTTISNLRCAAFLKNNKWDRVFHENCLLSRNNIPYFVRKLEI